MKHLLSIDDLDRARASTSCSTCRSTFLDGDPARHPEGPGAAGQGGGVALLRGLHPHPLSLRDRGQAPLVRRHDLHASAQSSVKKGESLLDTVQTIEAMGIDAIVVRHPAAGAPHRVAELDRRRRWSTPATAATSTPPRRCSTCSRCAATAAPTLDGLRVAIVGDIRHSRVARSSVQALAHARRRRHAGRAAHAAARVARGLAGHGEPRPRRRALRGRRRVRCCASSTSASGEALFPSAARVHARATGSPRARRAAASPTRSSCTRAR